MTSIVALGDSISFGVGDLCGSDVGPGWSGRLATAIGVADHQRLAWPGAQLSEMVHSQLPATVMSEPDIALVSIGGNDAIRRGFDAYQFSTELRSALDALKSAIPVVVVATLPDISQTCQIPRSLRPHLHRRVDQLNQAILSAAQRAQVQVLDRWTDEHSYLDSHLAADRVHPSALGYQSLAERTARVLGLPTVPSPMESSPQCAVSRWWVAAHGVPWALKRSVRLVPSVLSMLRQESGSRFSG